MKRHKEHDKKLTIRMPIAMHELLIEMATLQEVSISEMVRLLLSKNVNDYRMHRDAE